AARDSRPDSASATEAARMMVRMDFSLVVELGRPVAELDSFGVFARARPARMPPRLVLGYGDAVLVDLEDGRKLRASRVEPWFHGGVRLVVMENLSRVWRAVVALATTPVAKAR